jgi:uncharacterized protein YdbL (DUF1318 family)
VNDAVRKIEPVRAGRFSHKLVVHESPEVVARLEEVAHANGASVAAIVRVATRALLERVEPNETRIR